MKKLILIVSLLLVTAAHIKAQSRTALMSIGTQSTILRFYPNPATNNITFDFQRAFDKGYSLQIYNAVLGRKMLEQVNIGEKLTVDLSNFTRGVYVYQLIDRSGKLVETGKFQVSK